MLVVKILRGPHLVLPYSGGDYGVTASNVVDRLDDSVGLDQLTFPVVVQGISFLQGRYLAVPFTEVRRNSMPLSILVNGLQVLLKDTNVGPVDCLYLANFRRINIKLGYFPGFRRKFLRHTRNTVVKTRSDGNQEIAVINRVVGTRQAVHAQHMQ